MHPELSGPGTTLPMELQLADALLALLRQEQQCLIEADTAGVLPLLEEKSQLVSSLKTLAQARELALAGAGHPISMAGMTAWLDHGAGSADLQHCWSGLLKTSRMAQEVNRVNGLLIRRHMLGNRAALDVLQGQAGNGNVYGQNGQTSARPASRSLLIG